jgi:gamma-glutamylcyclotransferase (GGCT)/AIG2-like uncharacterized protein YtfP
MQSGMDDDRFSVGAGVPQGGSGAGAPQGGSSAGAPQDTERSAVEGHPPHDWPDRVAVYGTLRRAGSAWRLLEPLVIEQEEGVVLPGVLYDTPSGYPGLRLGAGPGVPAEVFRLRDPAGSWPMLDRYEGPEYRRIRVRLGPCRVGWVYDWRGPLA